VNHELHSSNGGRYAKDIGWEDFGPKSMPTNCRWI
jgi:hypothetical protein